MGGNGSYASGSTSAEEGRRWKTVDVLFNGVKVLEPKNPKANLKLPEESHTPNSIYAIANKDGSGIKAIGVYGDDGKKMYEIHTDDHKGIKPHCHEWSNGGPSGKGKDYAKPLTPAMKKLLKDVQDLKK